jgi:hypothetical protein
VREETEEGGRGEGGGRAKQLNMTSTLQTRTRLLSTYTERCQ